MAVLVISAALVHTLVQRAGGGDPFAADFVRPVGTGFAVGGRPYRFVGFNLYDAASAGESFYHCVSDHWPHYTAGELDAALAYMHDKAGATVLRFWAYQTYTKSGTDWSGIDEVLALARRHDMRVLPVLEDGPGYCTTGPTGTPKWKYQGDTWYSQGYKVPYGDAALSYRAYVQRIVARYAGNPAIFGWEMMNEATTSQRIDGQSALVGFARDIGTLIHSTDPNHMVAVGTESDGYPGASGPDFVAVNQLPQIGFTTAHDYSAPGQTGSFDPTPLFGLSSTGSLPAPASAECGPPMGAPIACSVAASAGVVHKPMVIDEVGVPASSGSRAQLQRRAQLMARKFDAMYSNGVGGVLVWDFNKAEDVGGGDFDVLMSANDPLIPVMHDWSRRL